MRSRAALLPWKRKPTASLHGGKLFCCACSQRLSTPTARQPPTLLQFVLFGAMVVQSAMAVSVEVVNSRILNNQLTAAAAIAVGSSGTATFSAVGSDIIGNMASAVQEGVCSDARCCVHAQPLASTAPTAATAAALLQVSAAGALAISGAAHVRAAGTGGSARENVVQGAGLVASGGPASANADAFSIPGEDNGVWGAGLPFTEQPMVAEVIKTVFDAGEGTCVCLR